MLSLFYKVRIEPSDFSGSCASFPCEFYVGVFGFGVASEFTITVTAGDNDDTIWLLESVPQVGSAKDWTFRYYAVSLQPHGAGWSLMLCVFTQFNASYIDAAHRQAVEFVATPLSGDVDLYVSNTVRLAPSWMCCLAFQSLCSLNVSAFQPNFHSPIQRPVLPTVVCKKHATSSPSSPCVQYEVQNYDKSSRELGSQERVWFDNTYTYPLFVVGVLATTYDGASTSEFEVTAYLSGDVVTLTEAVPMSDLVEDRNYKDYRWGEFHPSCYGVLLSVRFRFEITEAKDYMVEATVYLGNATILGNEADGSGKRARPGHATYTGTSAENGRFQRFTVPVSRCDECNRGALCSLQYSSLSTDCKNKVSSQETCSILISVFGNPTDSGASSFR